MQPHSHVVGVRPYLLTTYKARTGRKGSGEERSHPPVNRDERTHRRRTHDYSGSSLQDRSLLDKSGQDTAPVFDMRKRTPSTEATDDE